jgi:hypothetical protein
VGVGAAGDGVAAGMGGGSGVAAGRGGGAAGGSGGGGGDPGRWVLAGDCGAAAAGRRAGVFVKAVGPEPNPDSPDAHRAEARNMALLPRSAPAPRLLWSLDRRGWVALAFEDVDGAQPTLPWRPGQLRRVLEMVATMAADLTPAPAGFPPIGERLQDSFVGWRRLAAAHAAGDDDLAGLDPWAVRHLERPATWRRAGRGPVRVKPCSTPTCGPTTCC